MRRCLTTAMISALIAGTAGTAAACRGMAHQVLPWTSAQGPVLAFSSEAEHVAFDLEGVSGRFSALYPRVELLGSGWNIGALVPVVDLRKDGHGVERGFGNPRIYGQATVWRPLGLSAGV